MKPTHSNAHWWLGVADLLAHGVQHGVVKLQRIHLSVADESFRVLEAIPATRHSSRIVRVCHHEISRLSYTGLSLAGRAAAGLAARAAAGHVRKHDLNMNNS